MAETENGMYVVLDTNSEQIKLILQQLKDCTNDEKLGPIIAELEVEKKILFNDYFELLSKVWDHSRDTIKDVRMEERLEHASPYNVFFNTLLHCPETKKQPYSIGFTDLLCPSLGQLTRSFHVTFIAKVWWILARYAERGLHKLPMTIIHGYNEAPWLEPDTISDLYPNIGYRYIPPKDKFLGCHHSKLSMFAYEDDSLRLVIGSANLYAEDWDIYNQQVWVSPKCPKLPEGSSIMDGDSPTGFKLALLDYLFSYNDRDISTLKDWIDLVKRTDFREVKVVLLYTVPGIHYPRRNGSFIHFLGHVLSRDCVVPTDQQDQWRIVAQTASLGLMGLNPDQWLTTNFLKSLGSHTEARYLPTLPSTSRVNFSLVYPTMENCLNGYLGWQSACCCIYEKGVKETQPWLVQFQCQWKAHKTKRTRAISHSKCYFRVSPCWRKMAYFFLSSANFSRSGWGSVPNMDSAIFCRSYEMGVLFLPKYFGEEYFELSETDPDRKNQKLFPMMFDLPLIPYGPDDEPYCGEEILNAVQNDTENNEKAEAPALVNKRDMKYDGKAANNSFFPDFKKN